jgi:two-component system chemotaxis sensor kinase CheA
MSRDPELQRLLLLELRRHLETIAGDDSDTGAVDRAVHALKGSAGLAGEAELASALQRLERRLRSDDPEARPAAVEIVRVAIQRLAAGESAMLAEWPCPPEGLLALPLETATREHYVAEVSDRLAQIDVALASAGDPIDAAASVYRQVHTLKGAASAVGDEPMTWFCHGLEEQLRAAAASRESAVGALQEVARWRGVLGGLVEDGDFALRTLRATYGKRPLSSLPAQATQTSSGRPHDDEPRSATGEATVRVAAASVDRLIERFVAFGVARERVAARGERARDSSRAVRRLRAELAEALRLIGPPRPWGAPAAAIERIQRAIGTLSDVGDELEQAAHDLRATDQALRDGAAEGRAHLRAMRQMPLRRMFARLTSAIEAEARRSERSVRINTQGADETIDRRLAEALVEPCLQLARNAVAHGIEPPATRVSLGKPRMATITLSAEKIGQRLRIVLADDGQGVDVDAVRARATDTGAVTPALAEAADDNTLLALLFLPGFSTRESSDLLAGRGIGLDIALGAVQRLGGTIRLSSRHGEGFEARIELPIESALARVLWVTAAGEEHALLASAIRGVRRNDRADAERVPHLAACLEPRPSERAAFAVELEVDDSERAGLLVLGVDDVGRAEDVLVRPLGTLLSSMGPFAGAIVSGDGRLRLAVDAYALAPRARALGRIPDGRASDFPSRPAPPSSDASARSKTEGSLPPSRRSGPR